MDHMRPIRANLELFIFKYIKFNIKIANKKTGILVFK
jgi:hypothetical protein